MKKIILISTLMFIIHNVQSQSLNDTLKWLKLHIESNNSTFFQGKKFSVLLDSLKPYKKRLIELNPIVADMNGSKIQKNIYKIKIYMDSVNGSKKDQFHDSVFFNNHGKDTFNTHIPWILIKFRTPILYKFNWFYNDPKGLGSLYWNSKLELLFKNVIVESVKVGEY